MNLFNAMNVPAPTPTVSPVVAAVELPLFASALIREQHHADAQRYAVLHSYIRESVVTAMGYTKVYGYATDLSNLTHAEAVERAALHNASVSRESAFGRYPALVVEQGSDEHYRLLNVRNIPN